MRKKSSRVLLNKKMFRLEVQLRSKTSSSNQFKLVLLASLQILATVLSIKRHLLLIQSLLANLSLTNSYSLRLKKFQLIKIILLKLAQTQYLGRA